MSIGPPTNWIKQKLRLMKKARIIAQETEKRGGLEARVRDRKVRQQIIRTQKMSIRDSLITSWNLGEIKPPTEEERVKFWLYYHYLPMSYLVSVKRKYWET